MTSKTKMPVFRGRGRPRVHRLDEMKVGGSKEFATSYDSINGCIRQLTRAGSKHAKWKFKIEVLGAKSVRVWRVK